MNLIKAMSLLSKAFSCEDDHSFKADLKYILRVLERCKTKEEKMVVILHQLLIHGNHQGWTIERIKQERFPMTIMKALKVLHPSSEDAELTYIEKLKGNLLARQVRISEIADSLDLTQLSEISKDELENLWRQHKFYRQLVNTQ